MAQQVITELHAFYGGYDVATWLRESRLRVDVELLDKTTGSNAGWRSRIGGLKDGQIDLGGFANPDQANTAAALFNDLTGVPVAFTFNYPAAAGDVAWMMEGDVGTWEQGADIGQVVTYRAQVSSKSAAGRGIILGNLSSITATGQSAAQAWQAITSAQRLKASLHVLAASGTSPTLDAKIQSDVTGFASPTDRITFAQKTAAGQSEWAELAGPITDDEWRIDYTLGGTSPDFDFVVVIGV